ncbi:MAG: radical SAM protein [Deltaproteobacteria bacterium]|nr:radical SAM protein [Deltaproteobacteria bacterium]
MRQGRDKTMGRKKQLIIPIFIPFGGCPNRCVFCDQEGITGEEKMPTLKETADTIDSYLSTWKGRGGKEIAFYGGSFTALPEEAQLEYLKTAFGYVSGGRVDSVRVSTRPDRVTPEIIEYLKRYGVGTVELGAQSMSDEVLRASGRGHTAKSTADAVRLLRDGGFKVGLQFMPGLPGDDKGTVLRTTEEIISLKPDFVRVYPTLVLKNTPLHRMYLSESYRPWTLEDMVELCSLVYDLLTDAGVPVVRMGLQPTADLERNLVAGPYHPSFRQLVEGRLGGAGV